VTVGPLPKNPSRLFTKPIVRLKFKVMTRRVLLYPGEDGFVVAEVPSLPSCISQGRTREGVLENVRQAISLHEEVLLERGEPLPVTCLVP
jgi:predicted RNase H-like HicB family nuclease